MAAVTRHVQCHKQWRCWVRRPCCSRWQLHRQSSWFIARIKACHSLITTILNWLIYNLLVSHAKTPSSTCLRCYHLVMSEVCEWERISLSRTLPSFDRALNHLPLFNSKDFRLSQKKLSMRSDIQYIIHTTSIILTSNCIVSLYWPEKKPIWNWNRICMNQMLVYYWIYWLKYA